MDIYNVIIFQTVKEKSLLSNSNRIIQDYISAIIDASAVKKEILMNKTNSHIVIEN